MVAFSHGSGSGRKSPRNRFVAEELRKAGQEPGTLEQVARLAAAWLARHLR